MHLVSKIGTLTSSYGAHLSWTWQPARETPPSPTSDLMFRVDRVAAEVRQRAVLRREHLVDVALDLVVPDRHISDAVNGRDLNCSVVEVIC